MFWHPYIKQASFLVKGIYYLYSIHDPNRVVLLQRFHTLVKEVVDSFLRIEIAAY